MTDRARRIVEAILARPDGDKLGREIWGLLDPRYGGANKHEWTERVERGERSWHLVVDGRLKGFVNAHMPPLETVMEYRWVASGDDRENPPVEGTADTLDGAKYEVERRA